VSLRGRLGALVWIALAFAGCGGGSSQADSDVRRVAETFIAAVTAEDHGLACRQFIPATARLMFDGGCDDSATRTPGFLMTYAGNGRVTATRIEDDEAEVTIENNDVGQTGLILRRAGGGWRIANVSAGPSASRQDEAAFRAMNRALLALAGYLDAHPDFTGADAAALRRVEPSLPRSIKAVASPKAVSLEITSKSATTFRQVARLRGESIGVTDMTCEPAGVGRCPPDGTWR